MERLKTEPVTDEELARAKNQIEAAFVYQEDSVHQRAALLARFELIGGYAPEATRSWRRSARSRLADLTRVARTWFVAGQEERGRALAEILMRTSAERSAQSDAGVAQRGAVPAVWRAVLARGPAGSRAARPP